MTHPTDENRSVYYQTFKRDKGKCRYCDCSILESYDTFSASHLDHLKPRRSNGSDDDYWNRVTSCSVCNSLKGSFDPSPDGFITAETFEACIARARKYVQDKRNGIIDNSYFRDYHYWLKEMEKDDG
jgi:HNH endonuclease